MKKFVFKLDLQDDKAKQKAMKIVSTFPGLDSISIEKEDKKLTVIGKVDPVKLVTKIRKYWQADIILVGPVEPSKNKEESKKDKESKKEGTTKSEEHKKEEIKIGEDKKEEPKTEELIQNEERKKESLQFHDPVMELVKAHKAYDVPYFTAYYYVPSVEDNPNACAIN